MKEDSATDSRKLARELFGLFLLFWGLFVLLSLLTYSQTDPSLNHVVSGSVAVKNRAGLFGAFLSGLLVDIFGFAAFIWPLLFIAWGAGCVTTLVKLPWWRWLGFLLLTMCLLSLGTAWHLGLSDVRGGGMLGRLLHGLGTRLFSPAGSSLIWLFVLFISLELSFGIPWLDLLRRIARCIRSKAEAYRLTPAHVRERIQAALPPGSFKSLPKLSLPLGRSSARSETMPDLALDFEATTEKNPETITPRDMFGRLPGEFDEQPLCKQPEVFSPVTGAVTEAQKNPTTEDTEKNEAPSTGFVFREGPIATAEYAPEDDEDMKTGPLKVNGATFGFDANPATTSAASVSAPEETLPREDDKADTPCMPQAVETPPDFSTRALFDLDDVSYKPSWAREDGEENSPVAASAATPVLPPPIPETTVAAAPSATDEAICTTESFTIATPPAAVTQLPRVKVRPTLPTYELLSQPEIVPGAPPSKDILAAKGERLMACLGDFGIQGEMAYITPGPVISMFEIRPAPGVKVSRILNLSDDLALALKATAVRIQAPVPGSDTVGVEIPNDARAIVSFRELLQDASFHDSAGPLNMALGKDIGGHPFAADLSRMPHLLVAGATGAGKSVCLNSILLSFLYKCTPDDVRFLLIDPKRIELAVYSDLPHLVHPVVTEVSLAKNALAWAVYEMDTRYDAMARLGVRNIAGFNKKIDEFSGTMPPGLEDLQRLPFLVIIIDELSDLMMTAGKEVEGHIVRLAQLARAAGIHLIVATQRPSVDVVTGLIKANFPCRISFQVSSKHDSRTILDTIGAEHLLGKGDMLFKPSGSKMQRLHGAFVSDEEVVAVVDHWKKQQAPDFALDFAEWGNEGSGGPVIMPGGPEANSEDSLYGEVINFVREQGKVSISLIQRRFRIGFNKAARFVEQMEQDGIIQPGDRQNKARQVNRD